MPVRGGCFRVFAFQKCTDGRDAEGGFRKPCAFFIPQILLKTCFEDELTFYLFLKKRTDRICTEKARCGTVIELKGTFRGSFFLCCQGVTARMDGLDIFAVMDYIISINLLLPSERDIFWGFL